MFLSFVEEPYEKRLTDEDVGRLNNLFRQLSLGHENRDQKYFISVATASRLLVARRNGKVVGTATLVPILKPTGRVGHIEDVVVDSLFRREGVGRRMIQRLIAEARRLSLEKVELTSNHYRGTAGFYQDLGFVFRDTNVYVLHLDP